MKRIACVLLLATLLSSCGEVSSPVASEGVASPNMKVPLSLLQLEMACEDVASIIMVSMSNRLRNVDIYQTRSFARSVADSFDTRFPELPADIRLQTRRIYMQTVSDQYLAEQSVIQKQVETFRLYGENKFKDGAVNLCKHGLANIPPGEALPVLRLTK
ncbi:hypothetical protein [Undibacterium sp. TS12]|uniref:hypothetical protein n=1 Tax=Undibacterium sp. TS12 TaxID=2908202 RepID=UPI001F4CE5BE|nr:hypothetical protein [Undibacterium sp. TS12]MCH8621257.1 hypothetical protein [Undibacterium sp. TS12]